MLTLITYSKYLIVFLYQDIRPLVLIMPKMNGYIKIFKVEDKINKSILSVWMMRNY